MTRGSQKIVGRTKGGAGGFLNSVVDKLRREPSLNSERFEWCAPVKRAI